MRTKLFLLNRLALRIERYERKLEGLDGRRAEARELKIRFEEAKSIMQFLKRLRPPRLAQPNYARGLQGKIKKDVKLGRPRAKGFRGTPKGPTFQELFAKKTQKDVKR